MRFFKKRGGTNLCKEIFSSLLTSWFCLKSWKIYTLNPKSFQIMSWARLVASNWWRRFLVFFLKSCQWLSIIVLYVKTLFSTTWIYLKYLSLFFFFTYDKCKEKKYLKIPKLKLYKIKRRKYWKTNTLVFMKWLQNWHCNTIPLK